MAMGEEHIVTLVRVTSIGSLRDLLVCESPSCEDGWAADVRAAGAVSVGRLGLWGWLGGGSLLLGVSLLEGDLVAERFELLLEAAGAVFGRVAAA